MRPPPIVVTHPALQDLTQMPFVEGNQPVQALTTHGPDHPFAERVRLRRADRRFQDLQAHRRHRPIDGRRVDRIAIVDQKPMRPSPVIAVRNWRTVQSAVGCSVVFQCRMRRVPTSKTTNT